jgi:hypothetical protein
MEWLAAVLKNEIQTWELWNEPTDSYWSGTQDEFLELVAHSSAALRRGNPKARIAGCSFVSLDDKVEALLAKGLGKHLDILTVHYTEDGPGRSNNEWNALLKKHKLSLPIWNTEEKAEIPLKNLQAGVRCAKFGAAGYDVFRPVMRVDESLLPVAIRFSVAAHCIGSGQFVSSKSGLPGNHTASIFKRANDMLAVFSGPEKGRVTLLAEALEGKNLILTDSLGRSKAVPVLNGQCEVDLSGDFNYLNGARSLKLKE